MRIKQLCIFFLINSFIVLGQKSDIAVKVYLEDACTEKNVKDAKVTLEGFEIPKIEGKYDRKGKFYYFTEIPEGYNTIMVYHEKYNEKGFQSFDMLPKELKFSLRSPYRVKATNDEFNLYKEDQNKIVIAFNDTLYNSKIECNDLVDDKLCFAKNYFKNYYPELNLKGMLNSITNLGIVYFYLEKKDKSNFKRFNDPIIKHLESDKNVLMLFGLLLKTKVVSTKDKIEKEYFYSNGEPNYIPKYIKYINYDTLFKPKKNHEMSLNKIIYKDGSFSSENSKRDEVVKRQYSNLNLSYQEKLDRKLLNNSTYKFNKFELDSLYKLEEKRLKKTNIYDYNIINDTIISNFELESSQNLREELKTIPYILVSNSLFNPNIKLVFDSKGEKFKVDFKYSNNEKNIDYDKIIIEETKVNNKFIYRFKNYPSPYGVMDLIEYYNLSGEKINQAIDNSIHL
ncbi:hypothetical protein SY27_05175 [Flavobacterium sp. 316]|uniref:hypothetical protein n=1 Tax=Flavobacterium sp. 316 TaxID=1603293 RepID=UPI0005E4F48B|nr:hypothetical protein [Flavobacterium sp. 316]KIX22062.1 hypothetical protein SY27_05175 [Flavobacterium sp. 316]